MADETSFIRAKQAAKILDVALDTFYDLLKTNNGPPYKRFGKNDQMIRIPYRRFMTWIDEKPEKPKSSKRKK